MRFFRHHDFMACIATMVFGAMGCASAFGQESATSHRYKVAPFSASAKELLSDRKKLNEVLQLKGSVVRGTAPFQGNEATLKTWYVELTFPMMTRTKSGNGVSSDPMEGIERSRESLLQDIRKTTNAEFRRWLVNQVVSIMPRIVNKDYHPVVRYNAMLTVANLNATEASMRGAQRRPPVPLPAAFPLMQEALTNESQIDAVRVAALAGILRHVELEPFSNQPLEELSKQKLAADLLTIIQAVEPPLGRNPNVHYWMQLRATEIIALLGQPDEEGKIADALGEIVKNEELRRRLRFTAGNAIGKTQRLPTAFVSEPTDLAVILSKMAHEASQEAVERVEVISMSTGFNQRVGGGIMAFGGGDIDGFSEPGGLEGGLPGTDFRQNKKTTRKDERQEDWEKELELTRRALLTTLAGVSHGIRGTDGAGGLLSLAQNEPHSTNVARLGELVNSLSATCDSKYEDVEEFLTDLQNLTDQLGAEIDQLAVDSGEAPMDEPTPENDAPVVASGEPLDTSDEESVEEPVDFQ